MSELSWPAGRTARVGRFGRAAKTIIQSITDTVRYWRRCKKAKHTLLAVPQHYLGDLGISRMQIPVIAEYAATAQVDIAAAIDHITRFPPAPRRFTVSADTQIALRTERTGNGIVENHEPSPPSSTAKYPPSYVNAMPPAARQIESQGPK